MWNCKRGCRTIIIRWWQTLSRTFLQMSFGRQEHPNHQWSCVVRHRWALACLQLDPARCKMKHYKRPHMQHLGFQLHVQHRPKYPRELLDLPHMQHLGFQLHVQHRPKYPRELLDLPHMQHLGFQLHVQRRPRYPCEPLEHRNLPRTQHLSFQPHLPHRPKHLVFLPRARRHPPTHCVRRRVTLGSRVIPRFAPFALYGRVRSKIRMERGLCLDPFDVRKLNKR